MKRLSWYFKIYGFIAFFVTVGLCLLSLYKFIWLNYPNYYADSGVVSGVEIKNEGVHFSIHEKSYFIENSYIRHDLDGDIKEYLTGKISIEVVDDLFQAGKIVSVTAQGEEVVRRADFIKTQGAELNVLIFISKLCSAICFLWYLLYKAMFFLEKKYRC